MNHPTKPVVVWTLLSHTLTAGDSWLRITGEGDRRVSLRDTACLAALKNALEEGLSHLDRRKMPAYWRRPMMRVAPDVTISFLADGEAAVYLQACGRESTLDLRTCTDLVYWLNLCLGSSPPLHGPRPGYNGSQVEISGNALVITAGDRRASLPVNHEWLAGYLLAAVRQESVDLPPVDLPGGHSLSVGSIHSDSQPWNSLVVSVEDDRGPLLVRIGRGELAHLAMSAYDLSQVMI